MTCLRGEPVMRRLPVGVMGRFKSVLGSRTPAIICVHNELCYKEQDLAIISKPNRCGGLS